MNVEMLWNKVAKQYSRLIDTGRGPYHDSLIPAILDIVCHKGKGIRVLDVGCGEGYLTNQISKLGLEVVGLDISGELIKLARQKYPKLGFEKVSASKLSTKTKGKFDIIVSNFVAPVMNKKEFKLFLLESKKVLRKNGMLLFSISHPCFYNKSSLKYFQNVDKNVKITDYKSFRKFNKNLGGKVVVNHYHRTLDWYFNTCFSTGYKCIGFREVFDDDNNKFKRIPYGLVLSFCL